MKPLFVAGSARRDLEGIAAYTQRQWGRRQMLRYIEDIDRRLRWLRTNARQGRPRPALGAGLRSVGVGRHVIFYRDLADRVVVVRVLHERMDFARHLDDDPSAA